MDTLVDFELLGLVSKITSEIRNHTGINETALAEFVIHQHTSSESYDEFKAKLDDLGADFPQSLVDSIDRLVLTLHPQNKNKGNIDEEARIHRDQRTNIFKGLAIPDNDQSWTGYQGENGAQKAPSEQDAKLDAIDDTFAMLEGLASKANGAKQNRKRSLSPVVDGDRGRARSKRHRYSSESRSRSRRRDKRMDRSNGEKYEDEFGRSRKQESRDDLDHGRRRRTDEDDRFRRQPTPELDDSPILYKVYEGHVTGIKDFGIFVKLEGVRGKVDGLVHVSAMQAGARVNHPSDLVSRNQNVKVKVMRTENGKVSLSMKEVDQASGRDLAPQKRLASGANMEGLSGHLKGNTRYGNLNSEIPVIEDGTNGRAKKPKKRMTSPERWEIKQLIASGAISAQEYPDIDEIYNENVNEKGEIEEEQDIDIEVREEEPPFLQGQTKQSLDLSPIRVVKAPDGSLNRAAMSGDTLARERRDLRQQEAQDKAAQEASKVDLNAQWNDPMVAPEQRRFASDLRQARNDKAPEPIPEWKRITQGKEQSYGKRTNLSIKEQRESLPVYKFRKQIISAVAENQLLIVVGDTGSGKTTRKHPIPLSHLVILFSSLLTKLIQNRDYAIPGRGRLLQQRKNDRLYATAARSCDVGCGSGSRRGWMSVGTRGRLYHPIRRSDESGHED